MGVSIVCLMWMGPKHRSVSAVYVLFVARHGLVPDWVGLIRKVSDVCYHLDTSK